MLEVHLVVGSVLIVLNLVAFAAGGVAWFRKRPSIPFWYLLRAAQAAVFVQALLGGGAGLHRPRTGRKAPLPLRDPAPRRLLPRRGRPGRRRERELGDVDFESLPADDQQSLALAIVRREMGIMAVSCGVIFFLALRAASTSGAF